jgi:plasmid stabilization system protein ParE
MKAEVVFTGDFRSDLLAQTRHLVAEDKREWAERLVDEVELAARLLANAPRAGAVETQRKGRSIRRFVLHGLPFVLWYHWRERSRRVVVLRLFHVRQRRPIPK